MPYWCASADALGQSHQTLLVIIATATSSTSRELALLQRNLIRTLGSLRNGRRQFVLEHHWHTILVEYYAACQTELELDAC